MSEKIKVNFAYTPEEVEVEVGGVKVAVKKHIPLEDKIKMAQEMVENWTIISQDVPVLTKGHLYIVTKLYQTLRYYTNIEMEDAEPSDVFDWAVGVGLDDKVDLITEDDLYYVEWMADTLFNNIQKKFEKENSLEHAVHTTFASILNGEDITETLVKATAVRDDMIDLIGAAGKTAKQVAASNESGKVKIGGNIVSIAKKKT